MESDNGNHEKNRLLEYQQFVLDRKTTDIRIELYEHMVTFVIYNHAQSDGTLEYDRLIKHIEEDYNIKKIPKLHLDEAIKTLMDDEILSLVNARLSLSQSRRNEIKKKLKDTEEQEENIKYFLLSNLKSRIPSITDQQCEIILENLSLLLGTTFAEYGSTSAKILTQGMTRIKHLKKYPRFQDFYQSKILSIMPPETHNEIDKIFNDFFGDPTKEVCEYLFSRAQSYVIFEILNLDPDLKKIQLVSWSKKRIYLDTNFLVELLFEGSSLYGTLNSLVKLTKSLGAQLFITEKTVEELEHLISRFKEKASTFRFNAKFSKTYDQTNRKNPFLSTYGMALQTNPKLQLDVFSKKYEEFDKVLDSKYKIKIEDADKTIDLESEDVSRLKVHLTARAPYKEKNVVEHDAYNILRVNKIRSKEMDETGPKAWLLTIDRSLPRAEKDTYGKDAIYASVIPEIWLQIISPFVSPQSTISDRSVAFTKLLGTNFKSHKVDPEDLSYFLSAFMDVTDLEPEHVKLIMGNDFIKEKIHEMKETFEKGEEVKFEQIEPMMKESLKMIKDDYEKEKISSKEEQNKELTKKQMIIKNLEEKLERTESEKMESISKTKQSSGKWKISMIFVICAAVFDALFVYGLSLIPDFVFGTIASIAGILGVEAGIIFLITKLWDRYQSQKIKQKTISWTRVEKLTLIGVVLTGIGILTMLLIALFM